MTYRSLNSKPLITIKIYHKNHVKEHLWFLSDANITFLQPIQHQHVLTIP